MSVSVHEIESILSTYTLEEILELNDTSVQDTLQFLLDEEFIELPEIRPLDFD